MPLPLLPLLTIHYRLTKAATSARRARGESSLGSPRHNCRWCGPTTKACSVPPERTDCVSLKLDAIVSALDASVSPRGYRLLSRIPRLPEQITENIVGRFGSLQKIMLKATVGVISIGVPACVNVSNIGPFVEKPSEMRRPFFFLRIANRLCNIFLFLHLLIQQSLLEQFLFGNVGYGYHQSINVPATF